MRSHGLGTDDQPAALYHHTYQELRVSAPSHHKPRVIGLPLLDRA